MKAIPARNVWLPYRPAATGIVKVIHGANDDVFPVVGATVQTLRNSLADAFNIPVDALALVNGGGVGEQYRLQANDLLEFVLPWGQKSASLSDAEILAFASKQLPLEQWDEDRTSLRQWLLLDTNSYNPAPIFDLSPAQVDRLEENFLVSPKGSFAYQNRVLPAGRPLLHQGPGKGMVVFNGDVTRNDPHAHRHAGSVPHGRTIFTRHTRRVSSEMGSGLDVTDAERNADAAARCRKGAGDGRDRRLGAGMVAQEGVREGVG